MKTNSISSVFLQKVYGAVAILQVGVRLCYDHMRLTLHKICEESPKEAIDRQVTSEMKYMIKYTTLTAEQMATRLHFPDTSYMCRYFKKRIGMTISAYRKIFHIEKQNHAEYAFSPNEGQT